MHRGGKGRDLGISGEEKAGVYKIGDGIALDLDARCYASISTMICRCEEKEDLPWNYFKI